MTFNSDLLINITMIPLINIMTFNSNLLTNIDICQNFIRFNKSIKLTSLFISDFHNHYIL